MSYPDLRIENVRNRDTTRKFLKYCQDNFNVKPIQYSYSNSEQTRVEHHHHYDSWYYPWWLHHGSNQQNVYINNKKSDDRSDNRSNDDEKEDSLGTKVILVVTATAVVGGAAYFFTCDYVDYKRLNEGRKKANKCSKDIKTIDADSNTYYPNEVITVSSMINSFKKMYKTERKYQNFNILSKIGMVGSSIWGLMSGLLSGTSFYTNSNVFVLYSVFGLSLVTYIVNKTYYSLTYSNINESIKNRLKQDADSLLNDLPPVNPDSM